MITVDRNGSVWITDVGRHQVLKFTSSGKLIMSVGKKLKPGHGPRELCKPTQVRAVLGGDAVLVLVWMEGMVSQSAEAVCCAAELGVGCTSVWLGQLLCSRVGGRLHIGVARAVQTGIQKVLSLQQDRIAGLLPSC